jgi:hypothetical protein
MRWAPSCRKPNGGFSPSLMFPLIVTKKRDGFRNHLLKGGFHPYFILEEKDYRLITFDLQIVVKMAVLFARAV